MGKIKYWNKKYVIENKVKGYLREKNDCKYYVKYFEKVCICFICELFFLSKGSWSIELRFGSYVIWINLIILL